MPATIPSRQGSHRAVTEAAVAWSALQRAFRRNQYRYNGKRYPRKGELSGANR